MNALDIAALAIYAEAVFGALLSATNAAGDIVTVAITEYNRLGRARDEASSV